MKKISLGLVLALALMACGEEEGGATDDVVEGGENTQLAQPVDVDLGSDAFVEMDTVESGEAPVDNDCVLGTNEGCTGTDQCCDADGNLFCAPAGACKSATESCAVDEDCGPGLECCIDDEFNFSQCIPEGTCTLETEEGGPGGEEGGPGGEEGGQGGGEEGGQGGGEEGGQGGGEEGGPAPSCTPGSCIGSYICCVTADTQECLLQTNCSGIGGVAACNTNSDCIPGLECCPLEGFQGCLPGGSCGGGGSGGGGSGGTCASDADCGAGEECCDVLGLGQGTCGPIGSCDGGGGFSQCTADTDCAAGEVCCELLPGFGGSCLDAALCPGGGGSGGGLGGCSSDADCAADEECCDPLGLGIGATCEPIGTCSGGPGGGGACEGAGDCAFGQACCVDIFSGLLGGGEGACKSECELFDEELTESCSSDAQCDADQGCCDAYGTGSSFCAPTTWCSGEVEGGTEGGADSDNSCKGLCGSESLNGTCYCDAMCFSAGDCCEDVCEYCGDDFPLNCGTSEEGGSEEGGSEEGGSEEGGSEEGGSEEGGSEEGGIEEEGGSEGAAEEGGSDDPTGGEEGGTDDVSYANDVEDLLITECSPCHFGGYAMPFNMTYAMQNTAYMISRIDNGSMPPGGGGDPLLADILEEWADGGYLP